MDEVETEFLQSQRFKALVWWKYIDNTVIIWTHSEESLCLCRKDNFKSNLKFIFESDRNSINFLDLNMKLNTNELTTSAYIKPTYRHQCLYYISHHIRNILNSQFFYSQTLRASRVCSFKEDFVDHSEKKKIGFQNEATLTKLLKIKWIKLILVREEAKPNLPQECLSLLHITSDSRL